MMAKVGVEKDAKFDVKMANRRFVYWILLVTVWSGKINS